MVKLASTYSFFICLLGCIMLSTGSISVAQQKQPTQRVSAGVTTGNDSLNKKLGGVNSGIEKRANKVNQKIDDAYERADDRIRATKEKLKAATIKKNTALTRAYHNTTAYYNIHFNANASYKEGVEKSAKEYPFNYTIVLPIFTFEDENIPTMVSEEMARALEKSDKVIKKHSLTTKPNIKKGKKLSKKKQEFYNKREFCNWIDDAYLLIGKANIYLHEYDLAQRAFDFVNVDFPNDQAAYEARIWSAIVFGATEDLPRAREVLTSLSNDKKFPEELNKLLNLAYADLLIREKRYKEAIPKVEQAIKDSWNSTNNQRYHFILGQLHQNIGSAPKAVANYNSVIRRMPPYDLEFHAKLNKAFLVSGSGGENMRKTLLKMAKDEKNQEYLDMIYFALAEIDMRAKRTEQAIDYYKLSAASSKENTHQRILSCFTLAKYFEGTGDYESAQAYYDSTAMVMPKTDPDYEMVNNKAQNLGKLAANLRIIKTEDSLQRIARMSDSEREKYVETQIALAKANEEKRIRNEEIQRAREEAKAAATSAFAQPASGKWYFYSPNIVSSGLVEFRKTWGDRKLADNWRRSNLGMSMDMFGSGEGTQEEQKDETPPDQTESYYLANVPLTDSLMEASNERLMEAMFDAAIVYKDYIYDNPNAIAMLETLNKRFPDNRHKMESYFYLYILNNQEDKPTQAAIYKDLLIKEFPDELLTQYVKDPSYVSGKEEEERKANTLYSEAYDLYQTGKYAQSITLSSQGMEQYKEMDIAANFMLVNVMARGHNGDIGQYLAGLAEVVKEHPNTSAAEAAKEMQDIVQKRELTLISDREAAAVAAAQPQVQAAIPSIPYTNNDGESKFMLVANKSGLNINQLKFNFIAFNADIDADDLSVYANDFNEQMIVIEVGTFGNLSEAFSYYKKIKGYSAIFKDVNVEGYSMFAITKSNQQLLEQSKILSSYVSFFQANVEK